MLGHEIIDLVKEGKTVAARKLTHDLLDAKLSEILTDKYDEIAPTVFGEAKKAKVTDKDNDSEDDSGETLDPVGKGDSDVDNDGDSDSSDKYLKNRRKKITKAIKADESVKKENDEDDEDDEEEDDDDDDDDVDEAFGARIATSKRMQYGMKAVDFSAKTPQQQSEIKRKYYLDKEREVRKDESDRERKERETAAKSGQRGVRAKRERERV